MEEYESQIANAVREIERMGNPLRSVLDEQRRYLSPLDGLLRQPALPTGFQSLQKTIADYSLAINPLQEAWKSIELGIPKFDQITDLASRWPARLEQHYGLSRLDLALSVGRIKQPWLDVHNQVQSLINMGRLQGIGRMASGERSFATTSRLLRADLGDWRDPITFNSGESWPVATLDLFVEHGFDPDLTELPPETFDDAINQSGVLEAIPALILAYGDPFPPDPDAEESFRRNVRVYDLLQRFETSIRKFIDEVMTSVHGGSDWPSHRLPNGVYDKWKDKEEKDQSGKPGPLIRYADFSDYHAIICRKDNWRQGFKLFFKREELVREAFQRLAPTRIDVAHARTLEPVAELYAFVEVARLTKIFLRFPAS